jgi:hypothetical protein
MFQQKSRFRNMQSLYDQNRGPNGQQELADKLEKDSKLVAADSAVADRFNGSETGLSAQARASEGAKAISNEADSWNPANNASKYGLTGRAAGATAFYGGSQDPANTDRLKKFSNLYSVVAGRQQQQPKPLIPQEPGAVGRTPTRRETDMASEGSINKNGNGQRGDRTRNVAPLDYLLRSGAIDLDSYYKAQGDDALYAKLMKENGYN